MCTQCVELGVTPSEALEIVRVVTGGQGDGTDTATPPLHAGQSVLALLQEEESRGSIVTFCAKLDEMLGGGLPLGKITEVCGAPGLGKTQLRLVDPLSHSHTDCNMSGGLGTSVKGRHNICSLTLQLSAVRRRLHS